MLSGALGVLLMSATCGMAAAEESFQIRRYYGGPLGPEQVYFKPCLVHLPLLPDHVADAGLEFKVDMEHGKNTARYVHEASSEMAEIEPGTPRHLEILERQLQVIDDSDPRVHQGDGERVRAKVSAAAAWGDAKLVTVLLTTCYVSRSTANAVLYEVSSTGGSSDVVDVLLRAGADGYAPLSGGRTALHAAMNGGHEHCAEALLPSAPSREAALHRTDEGHTALDLARNNDFAGIARRMAKAIDEKFGPA